MIDETDSLLINYELEVGDEIGADSDCWMMTDTIQKIDSVLVDGEYRRTMYLDSLNGPVFYEGIGHLAETGVSWGHMFLNYCNGIGFGYELVCYGKEGIPSWDFEGGSGDCYLDVGIDDKPEIEFSVIVDQISRLLVLSLPLEPIDLSLISLDGRVINNWSRVNGSLEIDVSNLSSGIYILNALLT